MRRTKALVKVASVLMAEPDTRFYGYPLSRTAGVRSGVLYPLLSRLEGAGWLDSDWEDPHGPRPRRRYYTVTPAGRTGLADIVGGTHV